MTNLGSDDTPVKGENFSLPAGAQIDEDGGDFVVRDSAGEIILRRDETAGHWDFANNSLTNLAAVETDEASIGASNTPIDLGAFRDNIPSDLVMIPQDAGGVGSFNIHPGDNEDRTHLLVTNNSDPENFGFIKYEVSGISGLVRAASKGTGDAPTSLEFDGSFSDGIIYNGDIVLANGRVTADQGSPSSPRRYVLSESDTNEQQSSYQSAGTTVTADNTAQDIFTPSGTLSGRLMVTGQTSDVGKTFVDHLTQIRNTDIITESKNDGAGPPGPRTYSLVGTTVRVAIDDSSTNYEISVSALCGGR